MHALDSVFSAIGDPTRRAILAQLATAELPLSQLAAQHPMSLTAVSKHVKVLANAGLVNIEKRGRTQFCRANVAPMKEAIHWLTNYQTFWEQQFNSLAKYLETEKGSSHD